ncbi:UDP-glycosyltransferase 73C5-like [Cajanus cajan]|uniref:UDP-glycosyltransferase 73C5-like n=1 Tax=Cajanus cajan TaxID=3821 RepID=UPI00098DD2ED|nr:UDP-glycosyltransferase 73C5-like [Cajanus cajan]
MAPQEQQLHFVLFPLMAQGHMIPMMDIAKILLHRNVIVTVVTTPHNATRFTSIVDRYIESGFQIRLAQLQFPCKEGGVPDGCENLDMIPSLGMASSFINAASFLQQPAEKLFEELTPPPSCIISDMCLPYTNHIARKFNIPRISFVGVSCFYLLCMYNIRLHNVVESITTESEYFDVPDIPDKIEVTIAQTGLPMNQSTTRHIREAMLEAEMEAYGMIMNSFEELEPAYAEGLKKMRNNKVWCFGPLSSYSNKDALDKTQRGKRASIDENHLKCWLDSQKPETVIYACFGSLCNLIPQQLIELGLALEASERPFIWVIREGSQSEALEKWIKEDEFEERTNGRSLLIRGWAPQLLILSHPAIGGFITHCGWNSTLEAICAGVPMLTWPLFADQFLNESLVVEVLKVGVKIGVESPVTWGKEEEIGVLVKKENVEKAIVKLMDGTSESEERRKRVRELAEKAKTAVEKGGSSHLNVTLFIQYIMQKIKRSDV